MFSILYILTDHDLFGSDVEQDCSYTVFAVVFFTLTKHSNYLLTFYNFRGGSVAKWSVHQTHSLVVVGSSPATCWICSPLSRIQILGHACK